MPSEPIAGRTPDSHWWPVERLMPDGTWRRDSLRQRLLPLGRATGCWPGNSKPEFEPGVLCWESDGKRYDRSDVWRYHDRA